MNFFRSVFSDEPDAPGSLSESPSPDESDRDEPQESDAKKPNDQHDPNPNPNPESASRWNFGGLIRTLTTKSKSVIETYRRDLEEFGLGLKKEIEVAHGSLENVTQAFDELGSSVLKGTAQIISQGKDAILVADLKPDGSDQSSSAGNNQSYARYSRFEAQVRAIQDDVATYSEEPEDSQDYGKWKSGFDLGNKREEIERFKEENGSVMGFYYKLVPGSINDDTFWSRYFYRVHKLEQAENVRASLVKRAISSEDEELTWDVYDDDDENESEDDEKPREKGGKLGNVVSAQGVKAEEIEDNRDAVVVKGETSSNAVLDSSSRMDSIKEKDSNVGESNDRVNEKDVVLISNSQQNELNNEVSEKTVGVENVSGELQVSSNISSKVGDESAPVVSNSAGASEENVLMGKVSDVNTTGSTTEFKENSTSKTNVEAEKSNKGNSAAASNHPSATEDEDLGWDEIEDLSSIDDHKVALGGTPSTDRAELRKRLSVAEDEEDLSWDIEDDDEATKA